MRNKVCSLVIGKAQSKIQNYYLAERWKIKLRVQLNYNMNYLDTFRTYNLWLNILSVQSSGY